MFQKTILCECPCSRVKISEATEILDFAWIPVASLCKRTDKATNISVVGNRREILATVTRTCCRQTSLLVKFKSEVSDSNTYTQEEDGQSDDANDKVLIIAIAAAVAIVLGFILLLAYIITTKRKNKPERDSINMVKCGAIDTPVDSEPVYSTINEAATALDKTKRPCCINNHRPSPEALVIHSRVEENGLNVSNHELEDNYYILEPRESQVCCSCSNMNGKRVETVSNDAKYKLNANPGFSIKHASPQNYNDGIGKETFETPENNYFVLEVQTSGLSINNRHHHHHQENGYGISKTQITRIPEPCNGKDESKQNDNFMREDSRNVYHLSTVFV